MTAPQIKLPMQTAINASLDMLRLRSDCTDAVVILINQRTGECKVATMRGDANHSEQLLQRTLHALQKHRMGNIGLISI